MADERSTLDGSNQSVHSRSEDDAMKNRAGETFCEWLLLQKDRDGWIGDLVAAAKTDPGFPRIGDPEAVRARLSAIQAENDMYQAVDDAEQDWLSY